MATSPELHIEQLWLDVDRPIQPRQMRGTQRQRLPVEANDRQMELRMVPPRPVRMPEAPAITDVKPQLETAIPIPTPEVDPEPSVTLPFGAWLLEQSNSRGTLGEIAKAAKLDRQFPRKGSADEVRARFSAAGADGDAFEALDDAEREYARHIDI